MIHREHDLPIAKQAQVSAHQPWQCLLPATFGVGDRPEGDATSRPVAFDLTLWTTPFEATKSRKTSKKREYLTPLPALAQRMLKGLTKRESDRVFPTLPIYKTEAGRQ
jgi:hypothetical protein